jgi:multimeric flavodoxin WrbA
MKVLGIYGSPRRQGNSETLMKAFLQGAAEAGALVEEIFLRQLKVSPCLEIYHCFKDGTCPIKDDMRGLYDKLLEADVVALASPVFFYGVTAQVKAMIDRTQALWARRYVIKNDFPGGNRQGVLLSIGATKGRLLFVGSRLVAKYFFDAINVR